MDESEQNKLILGNMLIAKRIGQKYASSNGVFLEEAIAEAYFWLTHFFREKQTLWINSERPEWTLGVYIKRRLMDYFDRPFKRSRYKHLNEAAKKLVVKNTDSEMIDFLSGLHGDELAWEIFGLLRGGFDLFSIDMLSPRFRKTLSKLRLEVSNRVRTIKHLQSIGITTSRDVFNGETDADDETPELLGVQTIRE